MLDTSIISSIALGLNTLFIPLFRWVWSRENKIVKLETEVDILKSENKEIRNTIELKFDTLFEKIDKLTEDIHKVELKSKEF